MDSVLSMFCIMLFFWFCCSVKDDRTLIVGGETNTLSVWDVQQSSQITLLESSAPACYALAVSNQNNLCFGCCSDGNIYVWDLRRRQLVRYCTFVK